MGVRAYKGLGAVPFRRSEQSPECPGQEEDFRRRRQQKLSGRTAGLVRPQELGSTARAEGVQGRLGRR